MARAAIAFPPTYDTISNSRDAYMHPLKLRQLAKEHGRYWQFHEQPTTVALPGNRFAKSLAPFADHTDEKSFRELLREYEQIGIPRPSGYADPFHETFKSPRVAWSINAAVANAFAGGWQQALRIGASKGTYYKYDLRSAYLWAASLGMPDHKTYTRSLRPFKKHQYDGLFRIKLLEPNPDAPFPFNQARECIATNLEIETYSLRVSEVLDGIVWRGYTDPEPIINSVKSASTWKQCARSYWGRWAQLQTVECVSQHGDKRWRLPNIALNIPWAHAIVSRVKMKVWNYSANAVHVYVDSVITTERLPTGMAVGDWRLEKTYSDGVFVRGPGQYGDLHASTLERFAGLPKDSPLRSNPAVAEVSTLS